MATVSDDIVFRLSAEMSNFNKGMNQAAGSVQRVEKQLEASARNMRRVIAGIFTGVVARELLQYADAWRGVRNNMLVAGVAVEQLDGRLNDLFAIAQRHGVDIKSLGTLYGRLTQSATELGASEAEMLRFVDGVATALRVQGGSAEQASGALLQMSQALGSAIVRAEEFNSINEGARPILQAVANGLVEAAGSVAKLRSLVLEGKVTSQDFFRAFLAGQSSIEEMAKRSEGTISQAYTRLQNNLTRFVGKMDESSGASRDLARAIDEVGKILDDPNFAEAATVAVTGLANAFIFVTKSIAGATLAISDFLSWVERTTDMDWFQRNIEGAFPKAGAAGAGGGGASPAVSPIRLSGGGAGDGAGGRDEAARAVERYRDAVADLIHETRLLQMTEAEAERTEAIRNAQIAAGIPLYKTLTDVQKKMNDVLVEQVDQLLSARRAREQADAAWEVEAANAKRVLDEMHERMEETAREWKRIGKAIQDSMADALLGIVDGSMKASEAIAALIADIGRLIAKALILKAIEGITNAIFGGTSGGKALGGLVNAGNAYMVGESGPELFVPRASGQIVPSNRMGGGNQLAYAPVYNIQAGVNAHEVRMMLHQHDRDLLPRFLNAVDDKQRRSTTYLRPR